MKNINEEIKRIMSLFNDDRLYGNLINEQPYATDTNSDGNIDTDEAIAFLKSRDYEVEKLGSSDNTVAGFCYNNETIKKIYTKNKSSITGTAGTKSNINSANGQCYIATVKNTPTIGNWEIQKLVFWDNRYISFFVTLPYVIDLSASNKFKNTFSSLTNGGLISLITSYNTMGKNDDTTKVKWLRYEAKLNSSFDGYTSLKFLDFWSAADKKMTLYGPLVSEFQKTTNGYNPLNIPDDASSGRQYGTGLDLSEVLLNSDGLGIPENGNLSDLFDKM